MPRYAFAHPASSLHGKSERHCQGRRGMRANDGTRTAGEVLIDQLVVHGAEHVFCVPGESYIAALDAFYDRDIAITVTRAAPP